MIFLKPPAKGYDQHQKVVHGSTQLFMDDHLSNGLHEKVMIYVPKVDQMQLQFVKNIPLDMFIGQQMKEEKHDQSY